MHAPDLSETTDLLNSIPGVGIIIALIGAVFLSLGAQFQHRGVTKVERRTGSAAAGLGGKQIMRLLGRPSWVAGTVMLGLAVVLQLTALGFAPLIVVQPIGIVALIVTTFLNSRVSRTPLTKRALRAVGMCVLGVAVFVVSAAVAAREPRLSVTALIVVIVILFVVLAALVGVFLLFRGRLGAIFYIIAAGILYGFVATSAKVVINRLLAGTVDLLSVLAVIALLAAMALGMYFVQTAYSVGSPDLVIAGLTVVDPMVAVFLAIAVLGEAKDVAAEFPWAIPVWIIAGAVAIVGVFQLARHHPQTTK